MDVLVVSILVKPGFVSLFVDASLANVQASRKEPGIGVFDLLQDTKDPCHFTLIEGYLSPEAAALHKETAHYLAWKEKVEPMMAAPRTRGMYTRLDPD